MRLHHLTVTAFGPFADSVHVDFDELNAAGLFLLTGPTGAGKSSLLDAVCFALYGTVPGARGVKALKSQHAPAHARPEVVLDVTVQGRRFLVRRTPEWTRPKKRGDGVVIEKAAGSIVETTGGTEHFLSSRVAEVGHLVTSLMGMNAAQFQQVALLPQGEFQTFLRASSQERHDVLQHLFRTDRFARIEDWVHDHSRALRDRAGEGEAAVRRLVDTVAHRADVTAPDELADGKLARAAADDEVLPWVDGLVAEATLAVASARLARDEAAVAVDLARTRHDAGLRRLEQQQRRDLARRTLDSLSDGEADARAARKALSAHERASRCAPVLALLGDATESEAASRTRRDRALDALRSTGLPRPDPERVEELASLLDATRRRVVRLEALLPREAEADAARRDRDRDSSRLAAAEADQQSADARAEELPPAIEAAAGAAADATARAAREEALGLSLTAARERHTAAVQLVALLPRVQDAEDRRRDLRDRVQDARERVQQLAAARLAGMAAELAGALRDGAACQVCGSLEHPAPASAGPDPVTDADQARAEAELALHATELEAAEGRCHALRTDRDAASATSGGSSPDELAVAVAALEKALDEAHRAARQVPGLEAAIRDLRTEQQSVAQRQAAAATAVSTLRQAVAAHSRTVTAVEAELEQVLGEEGDVAGPGPQTVAGALDRLSGVLGVLAEAHARTSEHADAARRSEAVSRQAVAALEQHGFGSRAEATAALLPPDAVQRLERLLRERADAVARAEAVLAESSAGAGGDEVLHPALDLGPDGDGLAQLVAARADRLAEAESVAAAATGTLVLHDDRLTALVVLRDRLAAAIELWAPVRDDSLRADAIARLVRGTGQDNQLQMRLSAYVLATRLDQVVAAANERLGHMRDQRYLLQRTGRAERRSAQAGLGLEIVDQWTGDVRAPTTLSGGETFVVSLALALGLADVVTHEAGGTEVETLFVDEGFGTLDADTLDDVMDRLDGLRAGGRTVGVVSHVSELRSRIPTQVLVDKGRSGSTVTVATLVG
jgi:exonuclease SbcC